jgi:hypothetical protein
MYQDKYCDDGTFPTDAGLYPNWNCPYYSCDSNACSSCGTDPPMGQCGTGYTCGSKGACGTTGCVCNAGYYGFQCEYGNGICPDQFSCGLGTCTNGVCSCPAGYTGYSCTIQMATSLPAAEVAALTDLYHATAGDEWHIKTGWLSATDPCTGSWAQGLHGVICDATKTHVSEIWLGSNVLRGELPASLSALTELRFLDMGNNQLTGFLEYGLTALLSHSQIELRLWNNPIYCPVPLPLWPATGGTCTNAGLSLKNVTPAASLAFATTQVTLYADLKGGAAKLAEYPELRVRVTKPDGTTVSLQVDGNVGSDGLLVAPRLCLVAKR